MSLHPRRPAALLRAPLPAGLALRPCRLRRRVARVLDPAARGAQRPACPRRLAGSVEYRDGVLPVGAAPRLTSFLPYSHRCRLQTAPSRPPSRPPNVRARTDHVSDNNPVTDHANTPPSTLIGPLFRLSVERIAVLEAIGDERAKPLEAGKAGALDAKSAGERSPGWTVQTARMPKGVNRDMAFEFRAGGTAGTGVRNARMAARLGALQLIGSALFPMAVAIEACSRRVCVR